LHFSYNNYIFNIPTERTYTIKYMYYYQHFYMFRRLLRHPKGELYCMLKTVTMFDYRS